MRTIFVAALLLCGVAHAQEPCNCTANLDQYIRHISENYAGFSDKVNKDTRNTYLQLVRRLQDEAKKTRDAATCYQLLDRYRSFFHDQHLILYTDLGIPKSLPYGLKNGTRRTADRTPGQVQHYLETRLAKLRPLEGIWEAEGTEVGVTYHPKEGCYKGMVLRSADTTRKAGSVLFISKPVWDGEFETYFQEPSLKWERTRSETAQDVLVHFYYGIWRKKFPANADTLPESAIGSRFGDLRVQLLDSATLYIRLNSCNLDNKPHLEAQLSKYAPQLATIPNWILDLRTNTGGSTALFAPLEPYLFTHTYIGKGDSYWATPAHTAFLNSFLTKYEKELPEAARTGIRKRVMFGQAHPNGWLAETGDTVHYERVYDFPKRVAILSSKENASAGESFLITAKGMSRKVTIFGRPSAGLLDYGDIVDFQLPCRHYTIKIPSRRANYINEGIRYDATGYPPDVPVPAQVTDWIAFVRAYWANQTPVPAKNAAK